MFTFRTSHRKSLPAARESGWAAAFPVSALALVLLAWGAVPSWAQPESGDDAEGGGSEVVVLEPRPLGDTPPIGSGGSDPDGGGVDGPILTIPDSGPGTVIDIVPRMGDYGYVWVDRPTAASSDPNATYSKSSKGGTNRVKRTAAGRYEVYLAGLAQAGGHVQVTAYGGGNEYCNIRSWGSSGRDLRVNVQCYDPAGRAEDVRFSLLALWPLGAGARGAYAWAEQASAASYSPSASYAWTSSGKQIRIQRRSTGRYAVTLPGLGSNPASTVQVTAYGGSHTCQVFRCRPAGADPVAEGACTDAAGRPADGRYAILALGAYGRGGHAVADRPTSRSSYTPALAVNGGKAVTARSTAAGSYTVTFTGLGGGSRAGANVQVTSHGDARCQVQSWGAGGSDFSVNVRCTGWDGRPWDTAFGVLVLW